MKVSDVAEKYSCEPKTQDVHMVVDRRNTCDPNDDHIADPYKLQMTC